MIKNGLDTIADVNYLPILYIIPDTRNHVSILLLFKLMHTFTQYLEYNDRFDISIYCMQYRFIILLNSTQTVQ